MVEQLAQLPHFMFNVHHPFAVQVFSRISIAQQSKSINIRLTEDFNLLAGPSNQ